MASSPTSHKHRSRVVGKQPSNKPHGRKSSKPQNSSKNSSKNPSQSNSKNSQVRIIGGRYKRQQLKFINAEGLRPTPDRLRETIFNWLMQDLYDAHVLDACAGSGALGFEALSRGAAHVTFIEANAQQATYLQQSAVQLKIAPADYQIISGLAQTVISNIDTAAVHPIFNIVFIDPPYALELWQPILLTLIQTQHLDTSTLIYIEDARPLAFTLPDIQDNIKLIKQTTIGQITASLIQFERLPNCT